MLDRDTVYTPAGNDHCRPRSAGGSCDCHDDESPMTVGDLLDFLATQPRDRLVVLAKDAEGNDHSPLEAADERMYVAETTWSGFTYLTPEQYRESPHFDADDDWPPPDDRAVRAVVLKPTN